MAMDDVGAVLVWDTDDTEQAEREPRAMQYHRVNSDRAAGSDPGYAFNAPHGHGRTRRTRNGSDTLKRAMDVAIALPALIFLLPVLGLIALAIKLDDGGPVLFAHRRRGKDGRTFRCLKFRTMVKNAEARLAEILAADPVKAQEWARDQKLREDPRVTRLGRFLRKSSLDELPQLWNILRGEMSIVGPRPIVSDEVARYGEDIVFYDRVRPGVLGLWQISGRNDTTYEARVALDVEYAQTRSLPGDLAILVRSVPAVLLSRGAY